MLTLIERGPSRSSPGQLQTQTRRHAEPQPRQTQLVLPSLGHDSSYPSSSQTPASAIRGPAEALTSSSPTPKRPKPRREFGAAITHVPLNPTPEPSPSGAKEGSTLTTAPNIFALGPPRDAVAESFVLCATPRVPACAAALLARQARAVRGTVAFYAIPTRIAALHDALVAAARGEELRGLAFAAHIPSHPQFLAAVTSVSSAFHGPRSTLVPQRTVFAGEGHLHRTEGGQECLASPRLSVHHDAVPQTRPHLPLHHGEDASDYAVIRIWRRDAATDVLLSGLCDRMAPAGLAALRHVFGDAVWPRLRDAVISEVVPDEMLVCQGDHGGDEARFELSCGGSDCEAGVLTCTIPPPSGARHVRYYSRHQLFLCKDCADARSDVPARPSFARNRCLETPVGQE